MNGTLLTWVKQIRAIKLLVLGAQALSQTESKKYIRILVTELFPRLCKQRIVLTDSDIHPAVKSTDGKQYISIPYNLFEQYLLLGQQYYIEHREWQQLSTFTNMMLDCCGYSKSPSIPAYSSRFQHLNQKRHRLHIDTHHHTPQLLHISIVFMLEFKAVTADFIRLSNEYYRAVCMLDDAGSQEKSCLIPICAIKPTGLKDHGYQDINTALQPEYCEPPSPATGDDSSDAEDHVSSDAINQNNKRTRTISSSSSTEKRRKLMAYPDRGGEGLDSYCMGGVDNALQILSQAADCMRHAVELWDWALKVVLPEGKSLEQMYGSWEQGKRVAIRGNAYVG